MSFRRTTEEGEIGEEEGEIIASPLTATTAAATIDRANVPLPDHALPLASHPAAPFAHRRNSSPPFRRFPPRGRGGGGGRGPSPRQNSWTAPKESRWGNKVTQGANEQQQQPPRFRPASPPGSSNEPIRKPGFTRVEPAGSAGGSRSFPPNAPNNFSAGRNESFRPNEPPRNEGFGGRPSEPPRSEGFGGRPNDLTGGRNDSFGGRPNPPPRTEGFGGRPSEASSFRNESFGGHPSEPPAGRNEIFRPKEPTGGRNESFGGHEPPQDARNEGFRPNETSRDLFSRLERARSEGLAERDAFGRQPRQQVETASYSRPRPSLEHWRSEPADANAYNGPARPIERQRSEQTETNVYNGPRSMQHQRLEQIDTSFGSQPMALERQRLEQSDTAYGPRPPEHRVPAAGPLPHRAEQCGDAAYERPPPQELLISTTAHPLPPHRSDHGDTSYGPRPLDHLTSTAVPPSPPHRSEQADMAYGHRSIEHRTSTTPYPSGQGDSAYGHRPMEHRTSAAALLPPHRSDHDSAFGHRPMEHRTSTTAAPPPFSGPPPPPLSPPLPLSLPPPPRRGSSYTALTFDRPEAPRRASASEFRPDHHKSFEPSSPRFGTSPPQMKRKSFEGSSPRNAFGPSPKMARMGLDSPRKSFESSPQIIRQTSTSSRFPDDSLRSVPMPPLTSSDLLARAPQQDSWKVSSPSIKEEPVPAPAKPAAPKSPPVEAPLTCSALGDPRIVARAEKVIQQLHELVPFPAHEEAVLPTKQFILKALTGVDLKIKKGQSDVDRVKAELQQAVQAEQDEAKRLEMERLEEAQRRMELEQKAKEEKRLTEHRKELQVQIDERQRVFQQERQQAHVALEEYVQKCIREERMRLTLEINGQLEVASKSFDKDIAKAQRALSKATKAMTKAESRMAIAVAEYEQSKEMESALPELAREREKLSSAKTRELISLILAENNRCAEQAHLESDSLVPYTPNAGGDSNFKTNEEWANEARLVTGLADALYTEPSESPYFEQNNQTHALIEPLVTEQIRKNQRRLQDRWEDLVEEYVIRKAIYDKTHTILHREKHSKGTNISCILGANPSAISGARGDINGGRSTANPYRRARRGNPSNSGDVVRSEYEQEQIIAELTAKEAMEKRIKHGGSKLPRQVCQLEKDLTATYIHTFQSRRVEDSMEEAEEQRTTNIWSDMEKCIFLDRFMQHPKDFKKIASFLRNKSTKDCIAFYYNSKQTVPYKMALREHIMRRKRRGEYHTWDATIQASLSVGAVVTAGSSEAKPLTFSLPESDKTFFTYNFHPLNHEILDEANINSSEVDIQLTSPQRGGRGRNRSSAPLFTLDTEQRKLLRTSSQEDMLSVKQKLAVVCQEGDEFDEDEGGTGEGKKTPVRKAPQKWTALEKKVFLETLETHGKNWSMLASAVGSKSISQIKNYYYDHKKQFSKHRGHVDKADDSEDGKARRGLAPSIVGQISERVEEQQVSGGEGASLQEQGRDNSVMETDNIFEQQGTTISGQSLTSAADIWARAQILKQQQQISSQEARRLLHSHTHQQVMQNLTSIFPWMSAHVAQAQAQVHAQAAALQQQQQQAQEGNSLGATHAAVRDWVDPATQMQNLFAMRQASHNGFSVDPTTHLRSMAMAGFAAMNQSLASNSMMQTDATSAAHSSYHPSETDRAVHGFGGSGGIIEGGFSMGHGGGAASAPLASSSAALALGMLAHSINLGDTKNGHGYPMDETKSNEQSDIDDQYQSG